MLFVKVAFDVREKNNSATNEVVAAVSLVPAGGLTGFTNFFVPQYELNTVDPGHLVTGGSGANPVYELTNADTATGPGDANWVAVPVGTGFGNVNDNDDAAFVVGGRSGGVDNAEVLIVGSGAGVFVRSTVGGTLTATPSAFPGGTVQAIAVDPEDWQHIFAADSARIWETTDAGATLWTEITRNLGNVNTRLQSLAYVPTPNGDVVVLGGNLGVSRLSLDDPAGQWTRLGANLPNALVSDLEYHAADDILLVGEFGRGAWRINNASSVVDDVGVLTVCGDEDHVNQNDVFRLIRNAMNPLIINVFVNRVTPVFSIALAALSQINVFGAGGNDTLIVDSSNGLITVPNGIFFDGDHGCPGQIGAGVGGFDRLDLRQTGGTQTSETVHVGQTPGAGRDVIVGAGGTQTVQFENLEPVTTNVAAANFNITSVAGLASLLQDANQINYQTSPLFGATWGRVTVDNFEFIDFINKTNLTIDARAGSDTINLNNPNTPTGLTGITVNGGDPTGSDTLIVNGVANVADTFTYTPTGIDAGTVANTGFPTVTFGTIEHLQIDGRNGNLVTADSLTINSINIHGTNRLTPGSTFDSGLVEFRDGGSALPTATPMNFRGLGVGGSLTFSDVGRFDNLIYLGTGLDDTFSVNATGQVNLNTQIVVNTPAIINLTVSGLDGDDTFNIAGNHNLTSLCLVCLSVQILRHHKRCRPTCSSKSMAVLQVPAMHWSLPAP